MKATFQKSCSCSQCAHGKHTQTGHIIIHRAERKLRRIAKKQLRDVLLGRADDVIVGPISSGYFS
jgi:hypothetical protein